MANKLTIFRGRAYDMTYNHTDSTGAAVPLTGCTVYFTVKSEESDDDATDAGALIKKTIDPGDITDPSGGSTAINLTDADTYIEAGSYFFDVIVEDADGLSQPPSLYGKFVVKGTPTNRNVGNEV